MNWKSQASSNRKHISNELLGLEHLFISRNKKSWTWLSTHTVQKLTVKMGFRFWLIQWLSPYSSGSFSLSLPCHHCCVSCVFGLLSSCGHKVLSVVGEAPCFLVSSQWRVRWEKKWERDTSLQPWKEKSTCAIRLSQFRIHMNLS